LQGQVQSNLPIRVIRNLGASSRIAVSWVLDLPRFARPTAESGCPYKLYRCRRKAGSLRLRSGQALARFQRTRNDQGCESESSAIDVLLGVERGEHYGLVVNFGGVVVDGSGGLGAEVAVAGIEIERADVMGAVGAGKLHTTLDASDGVEAFHSFKCMGVGGDCKGTGVGRRR